MILEMSFQEFMVMFRELVYKALPGIILFLVILATWIISRFAAKYSDQKDIIKHMPEIIKEEISKRDELIAVLHHRVDQLESQLQGQVVANKAAYIMAGKVQEVLITTGNGQKQITEKR